MDLLVGTIMGVIGGALIAIDATKHKWVSLSTLREAHWAQDERHRWEIRTGRRLSLEEVTQLRDNL